MQDLFNSDRFRPSAMLAGTLVLAVLFLALDIWLPNWGAGGVPYVALVCAGWFLRSPRAIVALGLIFSLMAAAGAILGPAVGGPWFDLTGRFLALVAIWVVVGFLIIAKRAQRELVAKESMLEQRVQELESAQSDLEEQGASLIRFADDLRNAREQAELANIAKSQFLASVSHELRTPLNAIMGFAEVIKDEMFGAVGSASYRDYAKDIYQSGDHLLKLINDILDLSKVESGNMELHEEGVDVDAIIASVARLVRQRASERQVSLLLEVSEGLPGLSADERKVKQILVNLLANAIKFTEAGGSVTLKSWCHMESGFVFQVIDTGIGMAPQDIPKALSQFGQIDGDLNRKYEGTGLGLPLSKSLIELHGGTLDLQSQPGMGTTATVRFPAARIILQETLPEAEVA